MKIQVPFRKLQHIIHIADVHIRLFRRHEEYEAAFERLYADLRKRNLKDTVIVLAGDIVHAKTDMSPEMVEVTSRFLANISDIAPTILIAGNHDCNLANTNRLDALTPIVNNLKHPNLYYIRESALVEVADTTFAVCSIFDEVENWPVASEIDDDRTKIALYHGPVHGATTDANFAITNRHVHVDTFTGYDMVLLGDIHKHQILKEKNPIVVYASSLIQQNHGESVNGHGWCLWDVPSKSFEFVPLENEYGYVTLEVQNGQVTYPSNMPKNVRMRLFTTDLDQVQTKKLITTLRNNYNIIELSVNKSRFSKTIDRTQTVQHDTLDLQQPSTQYTLISDWLTRNYPGLDPDVLTAIEKINRQMNQQIVHDDQSRNIHWRPLNFKFSNMFSYGEDNEIDFTDMKGIYGIFASNASGKSSIMDALMFCLYDKTPRAFKGDHIINNRKDSFECELLFEINHETFGIKRIGTRKKNGDVKVDVSFWKVLDNGDQHNLNGEDRRDTNANIRSYVGTYEDFVMTALSSQTNSSLFIDKSHSERKDLLIQFMGLNIFDKLFDAAHDESKEIAGVLKRFKKSDVTDQLMEIHNQLTLQSASIAEVDHRKDMYETLIASQEEEYQLEHAKKRPVPNVLGSLTELQTAINKATAQLKTEEQNLAYAAEAREAAYNQVNLLEADLEVFDMELLERSIAEWRTVNSSLEKVNAELRDVKTQIEEKVKFKDTLSTYKYNPECEICMTNNKMVIRDTQRVTTELDELHAGKLILEDTVTTLIEELEPLEQFKEQYDEALQLQRQHRDAEQKLAKAVAHVSMCEVSREQTQMKITTLEENIITYKTNEENIHHNQTIDQILDEIQQHMAETKKKLQEVDRQSRELHTTSAVLQSKKDELQAKLKEAEELETTYEAFNHYMLAVGRDGIPYELMSKAIPNIESEINNILSQIVDFTVSLEVDGKNINGKLNYDYDRVWPLENSSGMERFVSSLAIRVALMNASNLPKSNFLIIDEGFATLDAEHIHAMQTLFNILKTHFDFILIVSHLDAMRDMVDHLIEIKKEDGYSQISV